MTDPNVPPERVVVQPERHTTVNVQPERRGGGGGVIAFLVGGLLVVVAIIGFVLFSNGGASVPDARDAKVDIDVNLPEPPKLPQVEPPTLPQPGPQPAN